MNIQFIYSILNDPTKIRWNISRNIRVPVNPVIFFTAQELGNLVIVKSLFCKSQKFFV